MPEVLSQEEVEALTKGLSDGEIDAETDAPPPPTGTRSFDFSSQDRIIRGRMPTLELIHDRFARSFRTTISNTLRRVVDVTVGKTRMIKYGELLRELTLPTSLHLIRMEPLRGHAMLVLEGKLVFAMVDTYFGGNGSGTVKMEGRDFTVIEQRLIRRIVEIVLDEYQEAWSAAYKVEISHHRAEINPQFVNIVPLSDVVVTTTIELDIEDVGGTMTLCLPYPTIEPIKDFLRAGFQSESMSDDGGWATRLAEQMGGVNVNVSVVLGHAEISGKDLLHLRVGDVLALREDAERPVDIFVEEILKAQGRVGVQHGNRAVQVERMIPVHER